MLKEAIAARPRFWDPSLLLGIDKENGVLLARWADGGFEDYIRGLYKTKVSALEAGRAGMIRELEGDRARLDKLLADVARAERALADPRLSGKDRRRLRSFLEAPPNKEEVRRLARVNAAELEGVRDPRRWAALEGYLKKRMDAMRRAQRRRNP